MSDQPVDGRQSESPQAKPSQPSTKKNAKTVPFKAAGVVVALLVGLGMGYVLGIVAPVAHLTGSSNSGQRLGPVFNRVPPDNLFSSNNLFQDVGGSPVDPSKILFPSLEKSLSEPEEKGPQTGRPEGGASSVPEAGVAAPPIIGGGASQPPATASGPKSVETPVIVTREPGQPTTEKQGKTKKENNGALAKIPGVESPGWDTAPVPSRKKTGKAVAAKPPKEALTAGPAQDKKRASEPLEKREQFRLPGSLLVKIHHYSGTMTQWGLMVIMDDSAVMARKARMWSPSRGQAAQDFVAKLAGHLTPGSKIAVRDFLCNKTDSGKKQKGAPCLSHLLYDWAGSPFNGLKEKLSQANPGGRTNPCAAAAYSLKKDFGGVGTLKPRVLIVTAGTTKCASKEVMKAAEQHGAKDRVRVDVVGFGMGKKGQASYGKLTKKSGGLLIHVDKPADVDAALSKYGKLLKKRTLEKIEVRGEKSVFTVKPAEEITLPPGTYTVVLPVVAGLSPSKRSVPNVRITSEHANVLDVRIKKGKPIITAGKK